MRSEFEAFHPGEFALGKRSAGGGWINLLGEAQRGPNDCPPVPLVQGLVRGRVQSSKACGFRLYFPCWQGGWDLEATMHTASLLRCLLLSNGGNLSAEPAMNLLG